MLNPGGGGDIGTLSDIETPEEGGGGGGGGIGADILYLFIRKYIYQYYKFFLKSTFLVYSNYSSES